jgi:hypothetical protein
VLQRRWLFLNKTKEDIIMSKRILGFLVALVLLTITFTTVALAVVPGPSIVDGLWATKGIVLHEKQGGFTEAVGFSEITGGEPIYMPYRGKVVGVVEHIPSMEDYFMAFLISKSKAETWDWPVKDKDGDVTLVILAYRINLADITVGKILASGALIANAGENVPIGTKYFAESAQLIVMTYDEWLRIMVPDIPEIYFKVYLMR